ncbi:MAG: hypothetical protein ACRCTP_17775 [Aeromonas popoffii]|uniref:hypothetical protein n=1 Tax=Aeromonas popoffii TaxID=70856 RepID=UPI003F37F596
MMPRPLSWVEILRIRSTTFRKADAIAKRNCSLPLRKSRGAFLQIHDKDGKQLVSSDAVCFPKSAADWKGMISYVKMKHPKAASLHLLTIIDSAKGWRSADAGNLKQCTGMASQLVYEYGDGELL